MHAAISRRARRPIMRSRLLALPVVAAAALAGCGGGSTAAPAHHAGAAPSACRAQAAGDPAELMICLAKHGVKVRGDGRLVRCTEAADTARALEACIEADAR
jgi:hypothetical protein